MDSSDDVEACPTQALRDCVSRLEQQMQAHLSDMNTQVSSLKAELSCARASIASLQDTVRILQDHNTTSVMVESDTRARSSKLSSSCEIAEASAIQFGESLTISLQPSPQEPCRLQTVLLRISGTETLSAYPCWRSYTCLFGASLIATLLWFNKASFSIASMRQYRWELTWVYPALNTMQSLVTLLNWSAAMSLRRRCPRSNANIRVSLILLLVSGTGIIFTNFYAFQLPGTGPYQPRHYLECMILFYLISILVHMSAIILLQRESDSLQRMLAILQEAWSSADHEILYDAVVQAQKRWNGFLVAHTFLTTVSIFLWTLFVFENTFEMWDMLSMCGGYVYCAVLAFEQLRPLIRYNSLVKLARKSCTTYVEFRYFQTHPVEFRVAGIILEPILFKSLVTAAIGLLVKSMFAACLGPSDPISMYSYVWEQLPNGTWGTLTNTTVVCPSCIRACEYYGYACTDI